ncbi:MAG: tetratricopeptide repeat protein, partial [Candidatus Gastranaerophilales bacterium]|nr:tetratricopeptide repeat protein [Candidatus Gastranaerophilales bacterium]
MNKYKFLVSFVICISLCNTSFSAGNNVYTSKVSKTYVQIDKLIEKGKYDEALLKVNEMLAENPDNLQARTTLGNIYSAQYKLDGAYREYIKVLKQDSDNADAHNGLGLVYYRKTTSSNMDVIKNKSKFYELSLMEFENAIKSNPKHYQAYNNAGKIYKEIGNIDKAQKYFDKAVEIEPQFSNAVENSGTALFAKNQTDAAIEKYKQSIKLNPKNSSAYYHLG